MKHLQQTIISLILACLIIAPVQAATQMYFVHNDHLGTPQVVTDQSQSVVWQGHQKPFGTVEETTATIEQLARFPGQYFDEESGFSYNYFRDYDPSIGRYIQSDPIGLEGGINTYGYVGGNPLSNIDRFGLASDKATVIAAVARGNVQQLKNILPALSPEATTLAQAAIVRLESTAGQIIAKECKASVTRVFPSQLLPKTLAEITKLANQGNKAGKTAKKLLSDKRFKK